MKKRIYTPWKLAILALLLFCLDVTAVVLAAETHDQGSGTVTVNDYTLNYSWVTTYEKKDPSSSGSNKGNGGGGVTLAANEFTVTAKNSTYYGGFFGYGANAVYNYTTKLTITNNGDYGCKVYYTETGSLGNTTTNVTLDKGASKTFTVATNASATETKNTTLSGTLTITKIEVFNTVKTTLQAATNGAFSYTVGTTTKTIAAQGSSADVEVAAGAKITLSAGAAKANYSFYGWMSDGKLLSNDTTYDYVANVASAVYPVFLPQETVDKGAPFKVGSNLYMFWHLAFEDAVRTGNTVVLVGDYVLPTTLEENGLKNGHPYVKQDGNNLIYQIPKDTKFLIPFSSAYTESFSEKPNNNLTTEATACTLFDQGKRNTVYRSLTVQSGTVIESYGKFNINGQRQASGQPYTGVSVGGYGKLILDSEPDLSQYTVPSFDSLTARLILRDGSSLYCYGYITGTGMVDAQSGSQIHELMQVCDWPGGSNALGFRFKTGAQFLISQYYIQSIEAPVKYHYGSASYAEAVLYANSTNFFSSAKVVTTVEDGDGLVLLSSSSYAYRIYDVAKDRMNYHLVSGPASLGSIQVSIQYGVEITLDSSDFILPIASNMSFYVETGATLNLSKRVSLLPGSMITVKTGGTMNISNNGALYIWDVKDWNGNYFFNRVDMALNSGESRKYSTYGSINCAPLPYVATLHSVSPQSTSYGIVRGSTTGDDGTVAQRYYVDPEKQTSSGQLVVNGTLNVDGVLAVSSASSSSDKIITGTGTINITKLSTGALQAGYSSSVTTITTANAIGNLSGLGTQKAFSAGTYYGLGSSNSNYWYQRKIASVFNNCAGSAVSGGKLTVSNGIQGYIVNGGSFTITLPGGYSLGSVAVNHGSYSGTYTISGMTADKNTPVTVTVSLAHKPGAAATCTAAQLCTVCDTVLTKAVPHNWLEQEKNGNVYTCKCSYDCGTDVVLNVTYRLDDYLWFNGYSEDDFLLGEGVTVTGGTQTIVSNGKRYFVKAIPADEIPNDLTITIAVTGGEATFTVNLKDYLVDSEDSALKQALLAYGDAAKDYFGDKTSSGTGKPSVSNGLISPGEEKYQAQTMDGVGISTSGATIYFDEALRLSVKYQMSGVTGVTVGDYTIVQVGMLVQKLDNWNMANVLTTDPEKCSATAYIVYNTVPDKEITSGGSGNHPNIENATGETAESVAEFKSEGLITFDLKAQDYKSGFAIRTYAVLQDKAGNYHCVYGKQYGYGLEAYIKAMYTEGASAAEDKSFNNLLEKTWALAQVAK